MIHRKTAVCYAVQWALASQMDEAIAKAEREDAKARQVKLEGAMTASMESVGKRFGLGLVKNFKLGLDILRGRS